MMPVNNGSFPCVAFYGRQFEMNNSYRAASVCSTPSIIEDFNRIKEYHSQFDEIRRAIAALHVFPTKHIYLHAPCILQSFNQQIANCKQIASYHQSIYTLEQLDALETKLIGLKINFERIRTYDSKIAVINKAIEEIPRETSIYNIPRVLEIFNDQITDCKRIVSYQENICTLEQLYTLERRLIRQEFDLEQIRKHNSKVASIDKAIKRMPKYIDTNNTSKIIDRFNDRIANCKQIAYYNETITTKEQLLILEGRLDAIDHSLKNLWNVLNVGRRARLKKPSSMRSWFKKEENQSFLGRVTSLKLVNGNISLLPTEILSLSNLQELDLSTNEIVSFPEWIDKCTTLKVLNFSRNRQAKFPIGFYQCSSLQILNISDNQLEEFPEEILQASNLTQLDLSLNQITVFPEWINRCTNLKIINLSHNRLRKLPIGFYRSTSLEKLDISNNQIEELPEEVLLSTNLIQLNLRMNVIRSIPQWIGRCRTLKILNLSCNRLRALPEELCQCVDLETLDVSYNLIEELPVAIKLWKVIKRIALANGKSSSRQLERLNLSNNPMAID